MLSYSTLGLPDWSFENLCLLLRQFGYGGMEIALTPEHVARRSDASFWTDARAIAREHEIEITCLHLGNPKLYRDPNAPRQLHGDPLEREYHLELIRAAFEIAVRLACPRVAAAVGTANPDLSESESWNRIGNFSHAALASRPEGVELLMEHEPEHFLATTDQILRLFDLTQGAIACNLDVGHLEVAGEPIGASIRKLGAVIHNVHLEDIKDRKHKHLLPGEGDINFDKMIVALREIHYRGPLTVDLYPYATAPIVALHRAHEAFAKYTIQ